MDPRPLPYQGFLPIRQRNFDWAEFKEFVYGKYAKSTAPFDKALHYIYKQFRCLYVHEGIGRLTTAPDGIDWHTLFDKIENEKDVYSVDIMKIAEWFRQITFESLFAMLTNYPIPCLLDVF